LSSCLLIVGKFRILFVSGILEINLTNNLSRKKELKLSASTLLLLELKLGLESILIKSEKADHMVLHLLVELSNRFESHTEEADRTDLYCFFVE
ncbi:hypothetical protein C0J52_24123, partial [Blattella germanica]